MGYEAWDIERIDDLESQLVALKAEIERLKDSNRRIARRANAADSAMAQLKAHPDSKLHGVSDYYFRLGYETAERDLAPLLGKHS
jgi:chromosome segregation ATPase